MTKKDLYIHIGLAVSALLGVLLLTFYVILPNVTNHGESMTVPNLDGLPFQELEKFLDERNLRYEVEPDSGYNPQYEPLAVLKQFPLPNAKVKENRKIYITLNSANPPLVKMPNLVGRSLKNAQLELRSLGLFIGEITYMPDFALNTILGQYHKGKSIDQTALIAKGSKIDFEVGDGLGNQSFPMLDLRDMGLEEATFVLQGYGLKLGEVFYKEDGELIDQTGGTDEEPIYRKREATPGTVFKQVPAPKKSAKIGQTVDLWLIKIDSTNNTRPSLDIDQN